MFTINDVKNNYILNKKDKNKRQEYKIRAKLQRDLELRTISSFVQCPFPKQNLTTLNPSKLKLELYNNFYNSQVTTSATCITESLITISPDWRDRIKLYFSNLKKIDENSATGDAFLSDLQNPHTKNVGKNLFVIKTNKNISGENDILHEAMVGMLRINNLREIIPNFACIYGFFRCGKIKYDLDGSVSDWCGEDNNTGYVIYENIDNSQSMKSILNLISTEQFLQYIIQFLYALKTANKYCKFTHYDCHSSNVLLRKLTQPSLIKYPISDVNFIYIKTDAVLTFIDYGMSYIEGKLSDGSTYKLGTNNDFESYNIFNDRDFIIHDVFKFICSCLYNARDKFKEIRISLLSYFFKYDPTITYETMLQNHIKYFFYTVYNDNTKNFNIDVFISFILNLIKINKWTSPIVIPKKDDKILSCDGNLCSSFTEIMSDIGLTTSKYTFKDIFEYTEDDINIFLESQSIIYTDYNIIEKRYLVVHCLYENDYFNMKEINQYGLEKITLALKSSNNYKEFLNNLI